MNNRHKAEEMKGEAERLTAANDISEGNMRFVINTLLTQSLEEQKRTINGEINDEMKEDPMLRDARAKLQSAEIQFQVAKNNYVDMQETIGMNETTLQSRYVKAAMRQEECSERLSAILSEYNVRKQQQTDLLLNEIWDNLGPHVIPNLTKPNFIAIFETNNQMELLNQLRNRYLDQE